MADGMKLKGGRTRPRHFLILAALTLVSFALHFVVTDQVGRSLPTAGDKQQETIKRMEAAYVKEVKLSAPPVGMVPPVPALAAVKAGKAKKRLVKPAEDAASAPEDEAATAADSASSNPAPAVAQAPSAPIQTAQAPAPAASKSQEPPKGPPFEWPKATKVSFRLEGYFRGKLTGSASVEWLRQGSKYQVFLDTTVGGIFTQQATSEGEITPDGLYPTRNETKGRRFFTDIPVRTITLDPEEITFPNGDKAPRPPEVQDLISNIIQMSYRFTMDPELLTPGKSIKATIATAKKLEELIFDVVKEDVIDSPMGRLTAIHVKPRRVVETGTPLPPVEIWFAPNLQYLPVRIYAEKTDGPRDKQFNLNMQMERPPQQVGASD
mgnify:CR=1 FL=1|jgi:cell division septation protein DedD